MAKRKRPRTVKNAVSDDVLARQIAHYDTNAAIVAVQLAEATLYVLQKHFGFSVEEADRASSMILDRAKARRSLFNQQD